MKKKMRRRRRRRRRKWKRKRKRRKISKLNKTKLSIGERKLRERIRGGRKEKKGGNGRGGK